MKRATIYIIMLFLAFITPVSVSAQKVESKSRLITVIKENKPDHWSDWMVKGGVGYQFADKSDDINYKIAVKYLRQLNKKDLYWSMQLGSTLGYKAHDYENYPIGLYLGPGLGLKKC